MMKRGRLLDIRILSIDTDLVWARMSNPAPAIRNMRRTTEGQRVESLSVTDLIFLQDCIYIQDEPSTEVPQLKRKMDTFKMDSL